MDHKRLQEDIARFRLQMTNKMLQWEAALEQPCEPPIDPPVDPPVDPPTDPPVGVDPPLEMPPVRPLPEYSIPSQEDCDWVVDRGVAYSRTWGNVQANTNGDVIGACYRAAKSAGHEGRLTVGVKDNGGRAWMAGGYNQSSPMSVNYNDQAIDLEIVGLTPEAEVEIVLDSKWGKIDRLAVFKIGLRGGGNKYLVPQLGDYAEPGGEAPCGDLIFDDFWFLAGPNYQLPRRHISGMSLGHGYRSLVIRRHRYVGTTFKEHLWYRKGGGHTWIVENDLRGGNRTGEQNRPHVAYDDQPRTMPQEGDVVFMNNVAESYGFDNDLGDSGGSCISVWAGFGTTWIIGNKITDARYGCVTVSPQATNRNHVNPNGFPVTEVHVFNNEFTNPRGNRATVSVSATERVHFWDGNVIQGPGNGESYGDLVLDSEFAANVDGTRNGSVVFHTDNLPNVIKTYDASTGRMRTMSRDELTIVVGEE